jgi:hypothetical protein
VGGSVPGPEAAGAPEEGEWPDAADESSFLSEARFRGEAPAPVSTRSPVPVLGENLPPLEELVSRVPAGVRGVLDELFRAKFTAVRRYAEAKPEA